MRARSFTLGASALGAFLYGLGDTFNKLVMFFSNQQMPVNDPRCWANPALLDGDPRHVCMTAATHFKVLADWIHVGLTVYSPGDLALFTGSALVALAAPIYVYVRFRRS